MSYNSFVNQNLHVQFCLDSFIGTFVTNSLMKPKHVNISYTKFVSSLKQVQLFVN